MKNNNNEIDKLFNEAKDLQIGKFKSFVEKNNIKEIYQLTKNQTGNGY